MNKVSFIFGTRPEAIKLAPLIALFKNRKEILTDVCITGQHREMLHQVLEVFKIPVNENLDLMSHNQSLGGFMALSLGAVEKYIKHEQPDCIFVQGDTSTVLAASLAAFYNKVKIFHIEAGLRTSDIYSPFPEEMNRRLTSRLANYHFAPTDLARSALIKENISPDLISVTGNTAIDSLLLVKDLILTKKVVPVFQEELEASLSMYSKLILVTGHRRENIGTGFINICQAISTLARKHADCLFVYPVHLNPKVKTVVYDMLGAISNVMLIAPQPYIEFVSLMMRADIILTDSGGVQEEAPSLQKPILVMRENTERPEGIDAGCSKLVGTNVRKIVSEVERILESNDYYKTFAVNGNPYGDGNASSRILEKSIDILTQG